MLRWLLLLLALGFGALGALTLVRAPAWVPWRLAVLAGEYGHRLVAAPLLVAALALLLRGATPALGWVTCGISLVAAGLFCKPALQARQIARTLPEKLRAQFGPVVVGRAPFSIDALLGEAPQPVAVRTWTYAPDLALDFYPATRAPAPCVILVHGGGWDSGERDELAHCAHWLARRGYAVAAISYRLAPKFIWPAQRDDTLAAIAFLKEHARELGIDATRLVLLGRSAGGQIAETVAYTARDPAIRGVIALYAPADMAFAYSFGAEDDILKSPLLLRQFLGGTPEAAAANYTSASSYFQVSKSAPPTLLLHGALDTLVWHKQSERLAGRLAEQGVPQVFVSLPWATHAFEYNLRGPGGQLATFAIEWFLAAVTR